MTEQEYIDATNLAKLRIAASVLRDVMPDDQEKESLLEAERQVAWLIQQHENRVTDG